MNSSGPHVHSQGSDDLHSVERSVEAIARARQSYRSHGRTDGRTNEEGGTGGPLTDRPSARDELANTIAGLHKLELFKARVIANTVIYAGWEPARPQPPDGELDAAQGVRVKALKAAREVLVSRSFASSSAADPIDLVSLARYIENGNDPYDSDRKDQP